jgi:acyl-CoA synthetase (AMP-forming)/AMP-acid ligase II
MHSHLQTLPDLLHLRATEQPHRVAYRFLQDGVYESAQISYGELERRASAIATTLQTKTCPGSRALLLYPPGLDFIAAFFGCLYAGVIAVPAYLPQRTQNIPRLQSIATDAQATLALTTSDALSAIKRHLPPYPALEQLTWVVSDDIVTDHDSTGQDSTGRDRKAFQSDRKAFQSDREAFQSDRTGNCTGHTPADDIAFLQYTSGSTGQPKGVMVSHRNILHNLSLIHDCFDNTAESIGVSWLPPYHDMGLIGGILQPLYIGAPMVLMPPMAFLQKPMRWLQAISHFRATVSGGPNFAFDLCTRRAKPHQLKDLDLSHWQIAFTGAEPVRAHTLNRFTQTFSPYGFQPTALQPCYGMAESTLLISSVPRTAAATQLTVSAPDLANNQVVLKTKERESGQVLLAEQQPEQQTLVSCGKVMQRQSLQRESQSLQQKSLQTIIVDPQRLTPCTNNQIGEIWVAGDSVAKGYWNQPQLSQDTFCAYLSDNSQSPDPNLSQDTFKGPYLRTGDLGFILNGELFITGRLKDLIILRGQNHYPQDIELTVEQSHPSLRPSAGAVFTVEEQAQEKLVIVQEVERQALRQLSPAEVVGDIRQAVAETHGLQVYATVLIKPGTIPRTTSGKIQRRTCRNQFEAKTLAMVDIA